MSRPHDDVEQMVTPTHDEIAVIMELYLQISSSMGTAIDARRQINLTVGKRRRETNESVFSYKSDAPFLHRVSSMRDVWA